MRDIDLYQQVLGLAEPWSVQRVELDVAQRRVDIWVEHEAGVRWRCPHCEQEFSCYDHVGERTWRHLDTCQFQTHVHGRIPRVQCPDHGVVQAAVPWAQPHGRFTLLFERWIIDVLQATDTVLGTCVLLGVSWDEAFGVMRRAVERGRARKHAEPIARIGVDEKAFRKGHSYMTVVCDIDRGTVEYVAEDRKTESLGEYFASLTGEQRQAIEAVAMDMWEPYIQATHQHVPLAADKIVFDRFHIMQQMNKALDQVRRQEHRALKADGDDRLKGTKHWWLYAYENVPDRHLRNFEAVRDQNLKTSRAWAIKETLRELWDYRSPAWARKFFRNWFGWARRSKLEPIKQVALTLQRHLHNILTYCLHPVTNGVAEGLNSRIMTIKRKACGYRNKENFKTAIYFFCGGLDLYPQ
jgi:transposase